MKKTVLFSLTFLILSIITLVIANPSLPNVGVYNESIREYTITENNGTGDVLAKITLLNHSKQCIVLDNCYLDIEAEIMKTTVDKFNDKNIFKNKQGLFQNLSHKVLIKEQYNWTEKIPKYKEQCTGQTVTINDTDYPVCNTIPDGFNFVNHSIMVWKNYTGKVLLPSTYYFKFVGVGGFNNKIDIIPSFYGVEASEWVWWDNDWQRKKVIILNETSGTTLHNYTHKLNVTYDSDMLGDFGDLRFLNSSETGEFSYYMPEDTRINEVEAIIWVLVDEPHENNTQLEINMYYNNTGAPNVSSPENSFILYDNFTNVAGESRFNETKWVVVDEGAGEIFNGTGQLTIDMNDDGLWIVSDVPNLHENISLTTKVTLGTDLEQRIGVISGNVLASSIGILQGIQLQYVDGAKAFSIRDGPSSQSDIETLNPADHFDGKSIIEMTTFSNATYSNQTLYKDGVILLGNLTGNIGAGIFNITFGGTSATTDITIDYVYVRNFVDPEPGITFSNEITINPNITIILPENGETITSGTDVELNWTVDSNGIPDSCVYDVRDGSTIVVENISVNCHDNQSYFNVTDEKILTIHFTANSSVLRTTEQTLQFTFAPSVGGGSSGGGGGGPVAKTVCLTNDTAWTSTTDKGAGQFDFFLMGPGQSRDGTIIVTNEGSTPINITVSCQDVNGTGCQYNSFSEEEIFIEESVFIPKQTEFTVKLPKDIGSINGSIIYNIVLTDQETCENVLPVKINSNFLGDLLLRPVEFTFLQDTDEDFEPFSIPLIVILLLIVGLGVLLNFLLQRFIDFDVISVPRVISIVLTVAGLIITYIYV